MGLFIKTYNRNGDAGLLNVQNVEHFSVTRDSGITYTPLSGIGQHASYQPTVAYCTNDIAKQILEELIEFFTTNTDGVFDAYERVRKLSVERAEKIVKEKFQQ